MGAFKQKGKGLLVIESDDDEIDVEESDREGSRVCVFDRSSMVILDFCI